MPLPDERPRQSVANLIGRFEQQGKRQPTPPLLGPAVSRSASASSQITGDAAKEELKERRDWSPKPVASVDIKSLAPALSVSPTPSTTVPKSSLTPPQPIPDLTPPVPVDNSITPTPTSPDPIKQPPLKSKPVASGKSTTTAGTRQPLSSPAKIRPSVSSSAKSLSGSPPKTSLQSSVSQPIRPQHTGHSVTSNPSTTRQSRSVPRTAPSTPSRPKSSAAQNQAIPRPKTPSSGLFAPTASSLARSRNAPPPPPPPVRKVTLSNDAAERLSKPTAASLSKARTPVTPVPTPARVAKSTSTGTPDSVPRGSSKLKAGNASVKKVANAKEEVKHDPAPVSSQSPGSSDHLVAGRVENGYDSGTPLFVDVKPPEVTHGQTEVIHDATHNAAAHAEVHPGSEVHPEQHTDVHSAETHSFEHAVIVNSASPKTVPDEHEQVQVEPPENTVFQPVASEITSNGDGHKVEPRAPGTDIEDIVNLLEGTSKTRPQSIATIPDEITDEY